MTASEDDVVEILFPRFGFSIDKWMSYSANSNFLTPTDGFDLTVSNDAIDSTLRSAIKRGEEVHVKVNSVVQTQGYIDRVTTSSSRGGGTTIRMEGCDKLAQAVRAGVDPHVRFPNNVTLLDVILKVFGPFGYDVDENVLTTNDANRELKQGQVRGAKVSRKGKPLKSYTVHQCKPYSGESVYAFASRLSQRRGLWIWLSAIGDRLIVSRPNFTQKPAYYLFDHPNGVDRLTNIEHGTVREDASHQPSCIVATGFSYGGEADRSHLKAIAINELVAMNAEGVALDSVTKIVLDNPDAILIPPRNFARSAIQPHPNAQPLYLHDQESQTPEQLENFARRELALRQKESLHVTYTVPGHTQEGVVWCVDSVVDVDDDLRGIHERMWIMGRTFEKSRDGGTFTRLELIRLFTLSLGPADEEGDDEDA